MQASDFLTDLQKKNTELSHKLKILNMARVSCRCGSYQNVKSLEPHDEGIGSPRSNDEIDVEVKLYDDHVDKPKLIDHAERQNVKQQLSVPQHFSFKNIYSKPTALTVKNPIGVVPLQEVKVKPREGATVMSSDGKHRRIKFLSAAVPVKPLTRMIGHSALSGAGENGVEQKPRAPIKRLHETTNHQLTTEDGLKYHKMRVMSGKGTRVIKTMTDLNNNNNSRSTKTLPRIIKTCSPNSSGKPLCHIITTNKHHQRLTTTTTNDHLTLNQLNVDASSATAQTRVNADAPCDVTADVHVITATPVQHQPPIVVTREEVVTSSDQQRQEASSCAAVAAKNGGEEDVRSLMSQRVEVLIQPDSCSDSYEGTPPVTPHNQHYNKNNLNTILQAISILEKEKTEDVDQQQTENC